MNWTVFFELWQLTFYIIAAILTFIVVSVIISLIHDWTVKESYVFVANEYYWGRVVIAVLGTLLLLFSIVAMLA